MDDLRGTDERLRYESQWKLLRRGADAIPVVIELLADDDELVVTGGLWMLTQMGDVTGPALPRLRALTQSPSPVIRLESLKTQFLIDRERRADALASLLETQNRNQPWFMVHWLQAFGPSAIDSIEAVMEHSNAEMREVAFELLVDIYSDMSLKADNGLRESLKLSMQRAASHRDQAIRDRARQLLDPPAKAFGGTIF
jgi:hypothetical protein